ncbi:hypothetical protein ACJ77P_01965 [Syntrophus buswellii]|jgi:hypothetical protein|uniref:hypothetical protein n=1 Tax=Syntrophus TaxID=43773 RepID=UPI00345E569A
MLYSITLDKNQDFTGLNNYYDRVKYIHRMDFIFLFEKETGKGGVKEASPERGFSWRKDAIVSEG